MNIKLRFALSISLISVLVTLPFVFLVMSSIDKLLIEKMDNETILHTHEITNDLNIKIEKSINLCNSIAYTFQALKKQKKAYPPIIKEILYSNLINNPELFGIWSIWEPNKWDTEINKVPVSVLAPYWRKGIAEIDSLENFNDSENGFYYNEPKKLKKTIMIPPTNYKLNNKEEEIMLSSIVSPIMLKHKFLAVIGIDFTNDFFQSTLSRFNINNTVSQAIYNSEGVILAHSDKRKIGKSILQAEKSLFQDSLHFFANAIKKASKTKVSLYSKEFNQELTFFITPLKLNNLPSKISLITSISTKDLYAEEILLTKEIKRYLIIGFMLFFAFAYIYGYYLLKPIKLAIDYIVSVGSGNSQYKVTEKYRKLKDERGVLITSIEFLHQSMIKNEETQLKENQIAEWIRKGQSKLYDSMRGHFSINDMSKNILFFLCKYLDIQIGALYLHYEKTKYLKLSAAYSLTYDDNVNNFINIGEGLVGQAALDKKIVSIENMDSTYFYSSSSSLKILPKNIIILPFLLNEKVVGVLEFGSYKKIENEKLILLEGILENIAIALNSVMIAKKISRHRRSKKQ